MGYSSTKLYQNPLSSQGRRHTTPADGPFFHFKLTHDIIVNSFSFFLILALDA